MQWGTFSFSHGLLGLDFPTNVQAICFGQTMSECSSANGLHSRDLEEDKELCIYAWGRKKYKSRKEKEKKN